MKAMQALGVAICLATVLTSKIAFGAPAVALDGLQALYAANGFVSPLTVFSPGEVAELKQLFTRLEKTQPGGRFPPLVFNLHMQEPEVWKWVRHPELVRLTSLATGIPKLHILSTSFITKYPLESDDADAKGAFGWHQDLQYWDLTPNVSAASWIALDSVTRENGCVQMIPGQHTGIAYQHQYYEDADNLLLSKKEIESDLINSSMATCVELAPGEMSVHDGWTPHGSYPNKARQRRAGLVVTWLPADSVLGPSREGYGTVEDGAPFPEIRLPVDPEEGFPPTVLQVPPVHPKWNRKFNHAFLQELPVTHGLEPVPSSSATTTSSLRGTQQPIIVYTGEI